jgi:hypothetical protein
MAQKRDPQEVGLKKGDLVALVETGQGVLLSILGLCDENRV